MNSIWNYDRNTPEFKTQSEDLKTDVLIIGGGIAGILCAYFLKQQGIDYILAEADRIFQKTTVNTIAKITYEHGLIYDKLIKRFGVEAAKMYLDINKAALSKYQELSKNIQCDFEMKDAYVYSVSNVNKIENEIRAYEKIGIVPDFAEKLTIPINIKGALRIKDQAQFHPVKFLYSISKDLNIFENTKAIEFLPGKVKTNRGTIKADKIIVTTHFPILNKHGSYFLKLYQHRSYVIAYKNAQNVDGMYIDEDMKGLSFRNHKDLLLLGGGSHRTGKCGGNWEELSEFAKNKYKDAVEVSRWATQDCMTLDGMPYIGQYSKNIPELYVATGFNKWGMTSSMAAALILNDLINDKENPYASLFSPSRSILTPQLLINGAESLIGLLTPKRPRCPHLGCALKYNKAEHSWDCSCHGSRFSKDGKLLDNPSTDDIKKP